MTSGATANNNRDIYIGVALPGCDVEKGEHHEKGKAWYLRTHDGAPKSQWWKSVFFIWCRFFDRCVDGRPKTGDLMKKWVVMVKKNT